MKRISLSLYPTLFYQSGLEQSQQFVFNFAAPYRHFVLRLTGGCELEDEHAVGLVNLGLALAGDGSNDETFPQFTGFGIFGGTRYKEMSAPDGFIPGITEVFPVIAPDLKRAAILGIVARTKTQRYTPWGIVIDENEEKGRFTVIHPTAKSILVLQSSVDRPAPWEVEYLESYRICDQLEQTAWRSLLLVYNGGGIVEKEILLWAESGKNVLIVKDSGRMADQYANNQTFLDDHPNVHVAQNDVASIRFKLLELGALTYL